MEGFDLWLKTAEILGEANKQGVIEPLLCMCIDYVATATGMRGVELMDKLRPHIEMAEKVLGPMPI